MSSNGWFIQLRRIRKDLLHLTEEQDLRALGRALLAIGMAGSFPGR